MKKKGFTLTEILVVIAIIGIILLIAIPSIMAINKSIKKRELETKKEVLISAAELYAKDNISKFEGATIIRIPVRTLLYYGYITEDGECPSDATEPIGCVINPVDSSSLNNEKITIKRNMSITQATWGEDEEGNYYYVSFIPNGADGEPSGYDLGCEAYKDCEIKAPTITRTDYNIIGWNTSRDAIYSEKNIGDSIMINSTNNNTIPGKGIYYAITSKNVEITFDANGGTFSGDQAPKESCTIYNSATSCIVSEPHVSRADYNFKGWANLSGNVVLLSQVNESQTLYAQWGANQYLVTLNNQSATSAGTTAVYYEQNTPKYYSNLNLTTEISSITKPSRTGYIFGGYYTATSGSGTQYIDANGNFVNELYKTKGDKTLYAKWTAITYTVAYNKNNSSATGATASSSHEYGVSKALTSNGYKLSGHVFNGWNTEANGSGTSYTNQQSVSNLTSTNGGTVTLYAKWSACAAGKYAVAGATSCTNCAKGSYNASTGSSSCTACSAGKTTSATGASSSSSCTACSNAAHVATWETPSWSANSVTNLCKIKTCSEGYHLSSNTCVANVLSIQYNGNGGEWNSSNSAYNVNQYGTVITTSDNVVYVQKVNYGESLSSSGFVDYNGSYFNWKKQGYAAPLDQEYFIKSDPNSSPLKQGYAYTATYLATLGQVDLKAGNQTIQLKVNWKPVIHVIFDKRGGSGGSAGTYYIFKMNTYYTSSSLTTTMTKVNTPTNGEYIFGGYYTGKSGTGTQYVNADGTITNSLYKSVSASGTTLYAQWKVKDQGSCPCVGTPNTVTTCNGRTFYYDSHGILCLESTGVCCQ